MRPRIQAIVNDSIDRVENNGRMDLIADCAFRLPVNVICDMLGIPEVDREVFFMCERTGGRLLDPVPLTRAEIDDANRYNQQSLDYFQGLFELRRREPGDDLTTQLVQAEQDGSKLNNEELCANIMLLFGAGHETTVNLIGNSNWQWSARIASKSRAARSPEEQAGIDAKRDRGVPPLSFFGSDCQPRRT